MNIKSIYLEILNECTKIVQRGSNDKVIIREQGIVH